MCLDCSCMRPSDDHGDPAHITLDTLQAAADASGITPEQAAANIVMTLAFADGDDDEAMDATDEAAAKSDLAVCQVLKTTEELKYSLGLAYPAWVAPGKGADGYNDFCSDLALERCAWRWMAKNREIGLFHQDRPELAGHATVVESYIYRGPDWEVISPVDGSKVVIKAGDWMLGTVWDDYGWSLVKSGRVNGWSPEGGARRRAATPEQIAQLRR